MSLKLSVAHLLREIRTEKGLSLSEVARAAGKSKGNLSMLETEGRGLTLDALNDICAALDVTPEYVIKRGRKNELERNKKNRQ